MDRKEFLKLMGYSAASLSLLSCLGGCSKNADTSGTIAPSNVDFTIDLSQSANAALNTNGGYLYKNGIVVARTTAGAYIAVQQNCTHETATVIYQGSYHRFYCDRHGATYSETGAVTGGPAPRPLKQYNTSLNGTVLRVYS